VPLSDWDANVEKFIEGFVDRCSMPVNAAKPARKRASNPIFSVAVSDTLQHYYISKLILLVNFI
jgi:hypothetical protein